PDSDVPAGEGPGRSSRAGVNSRKYLAQSFQVRLVRGEAVEAIAVMALKQLVRSLLSGAGQQHKGALAYLFDVQMGEVTDDFSCGDLGIAAQLDYLQQNIGAVGAIARLLPDLTDPLGGLLVR